MKKLSTGLGRYAKYSAILTAFLFFSVTLLAQQTVTGKVSDDNGAPLSGVSVVIKGGSKGTTTNEAGEFSINARSGDVLYFSRIGFQVFSVKVSSNQPSVNVRLQIAAAAISDVVVIGYGTQKRVAVTGAISTVNAKEIVELPVPSVQSALQGRVAGLQVVNNGSPGTEPIVTIRGISSISYASNPLYVVDGFPTGDLTTFDSRDIESVDVLKDASAAAIYGSRATNGVIIITTKKGKRDGKLHVSASTNYGIQEVTKRLSLLNPAQFDQYALAYNGSLVPRRDPTYVPEWVNQPIYPGAKTTYGNNVTNWQDAYFKQGQMTQSNVALSGGNDISRFNASVGYFNQTGIAPTVGYKRYNFRINSEHRIGKVFNFGENLYVASGNQAYDNNETGSRTNLLNVIRIMPYMPVHDPTTSDGYRGVNSVLDGGDPTNPIENANVNNPGTRSTVKLFGTAYLEVIFTKWLKFRSTAGIDYANGLDYRFSPIFNDSGSVAGSSSILATITNNRSVSTVQLYTQQLSFDKTIGNHHLGAIAVYEYQGQTVRNENASGNQASNQLTTLNNGSNISYQSLIGKNALISYLGRVNYDFKGKYLLSGAIRRDGLSVWAPGRKWATFPSGSVGWRVDQEDFMRGLTKISELKLRGGYGITGLNGTILGNTPWLVGVNANSAYYPFGNSLNAGPSSSIQALGNNQLNWEKTKQINIGLDLGLFNNAFTLSAEYYRRKTDNLILSDPLPPSVGFLTSTVPENIASMSNNGFELQVGYTHRQGAIQWNVGGNFSFIRNKVLNLASGVTSIQAGADGDFTEGYNATNTVVGHPIQSFYGWQTEGIFQNAADVAKHAIQAPGTPGTAPGDLKFKDINGDGVIDNKDEVFLGSFIPKFTYALNSGAGYKNFTLSVFFQGVQGNKIYNATRTATEGMIRFFNAGTQVLNAWTPSHTNTNIPRAISADPNNNARPSNRFVEDGSYLRLKNIILSYNVPANSLQSITKGVVSNISIYISAQNLLTFTKYSGYDPEVGNHIPGSSTLTNGIDYAVYPQPKGFQVGINANF
jgi:TonB-dependent starch-binding outer membrane protein SusC